MKICTNGARHFGAQLPRIEEGFRALGHEITPYISDADMVYSNDSHAQIIRDKSAGRLKPGAKVILTCLDVPEHLFPRFDLDGLRNQLSQADAVCTISQFGYHQVNLFCGIKSHVIYQPIKPIEPFVVVRSRQAPRFLHCGRRFDENKRFAIGASALQLLGYNARDLILVGNEHGWGDWRAVLNDYELNLTYRSVDFVMCTSRIEGLCLPVLEAMAAGAVPVVCNDLSTRAEILPPDLFPEYNEVEPSRQSVARFIAGLVNDESGARLQELKDRLHRHYLENWKEKTSSAGVARRILEVYASINGDDYRFGEQGCT